jgi:regulation of enolase protein 1 (concanavalin A-like superfamily)
MKWRSEPRQWQALPDGIQLTTDAGTDFWRHTHYGFARDDGHFRFDTVHRDFELEVTIAGDYRDQDDQAGLMVRTDDEHWIKCDIELVDDRELVSAVVTNRLSE